MVEFMYRGENRIPCQLLLPLLTTAQAFKVKEPTTVVNVIMTSNSLNIEKLKAIGNMDKEVLELETTDYTHVECDKLLKDKCFCNGDDGRNSSNSSENISLDGNASDDSPDQESEHTLYEESRDSESNTGQTDALFSVANSATKRSRDSSQLAGSVGSEDVPTTNGCCTSGVNNETPCDANNDQLKPVLYEQCCDLSDIDDESSVEMSLTESCLKQIERDFARYKFEGTDVPSKLGKFVKVYTHKRRKSIDEIKTKLTDMNNVIHSPPSTDCIDLLDEPSTNTDIPVTLLTSLDIESAEYIISLSTENIQSIIGATLTREAREPPTENTRKRLRMIEQNDENEESKEEKEEEPRSTTTKDTETSNCAKPILRRSSRLNQQEVETIVNNNETEKTDSGEKKPNLKKSNHPNANAETELLCIKRKRNKIKDADRKVPEQKQQQQAKKPLNHPRKNSKLIVKKNKCTKEKNEQAIREENRFKYDTSENDSIFASSKLNTIEHISSRALWGDMSDFSEDCNIHLLEYDTPNTEIPFAVGLLPLRTALEKMQATPDYQPRKTRSSVAIAAPVRQQQQQHQDIVGSFKRKRLTSYIGDPKENAKAVCHIQIRTAPSQYIRNRKKYLPTDINTLESPTIVNKH